MNIINKHEVIMFSRCLEQIVRFPKLWATSLANMILKIEYQPSANFMDAVEILSNAFKRHDPPTLTSMFSFGKGCVLAGSCPAEQMLGRLLLLMLRKEIIYKYYYEKSQDKLLAQLLASFK